MQKTKTLLAKFLSILCAVCCVFALVLGLVGCGEDGHGYVESFYTDADGYLCVKYTDGTSEQICILDAGKDGEKGETGPAGPAGPSGSNGADGQNGKDGVGVKGVTINDEGILTIEYTDGKKVPLGNVVGANGKDGTDGTDGEDGKDGVNGRGITEVTYDKTSGNFVVTYTDGETQDIKVEGLGNTNPGTDPVPEGVYVVSIKLDEANKKYVVTYSDKSTANVDLPVFVTGGTIKDNVLYLTYSDGSEKEIGKVFSGDLSNPNVQIVSIVPDKAANTVTITWKEWDAEKQEYSANKSEVISLTGSNNGEPVGSAHKHEGEAAWYSVVLESPKDHEKEPGFKKSDLCLKPTITMNICKVPTNEYNTIGGEGANKNDPLANKTEEEGKAPTYTPAYQTCGVTTITYEIAGHKEGPKDEVKPTCTEAGYYGTKCTVCETPIAVSEEGEPARKHSFERVEGKEWAIYNEETGEYEITKLGIENTIPTVEAGKVLCKDGGQRVIQCEDCGVAVSIYEKAPGHIFKEWKVLEVEGSDGSLTKLEPTYGTAKAPGKSGTIVPVGTCEYCGQSYESDKITATIPALETKIDDKNVYVGENYGSKSCTATNRTRTYTIYVDCAGRYINPTTKEVYKKGDAEVVSTLNITVARPNGSHVIKYLGDVENEETGLRPGIYADHDKPTSEGYDSEYPAGYYVIQEYDGLIRPLEDEDYKNGIMWCERTLGNAKGVFECEECGQSVVVTIIDQHEHAKNATPIFAVDEEGNPVLDDKDQPLVAGTNASKLATCEEDGEPYYTCTKCQKGYFDTYTEHDDLPEEFKATGHNYQFTYTFKSTDKNGDGTYVDGIPSVNFAVTCLNVNDNSHDITVPSTAVGHCVKATTCMDEGIYYWTWTDAKGDHTTGELTFPKLKAHTLIANDTVVEKAIADATLNYEYYKNYIRNDPNNTDENGEIIWVDKAEGGLITIVEGQGTITDCSNGLSAYFSCTVCSEKLKKEIRVLVQIPHKAPDMVEGENTNIVPVEAKKENDGGVDKLVVTGLPVDGKLVAGKVYYAAPTCTSFGYKAYLCETCSHPIYLVGDNDLANTDSAKGDIVEYDSTLQAKGHTYDYSLELTDKTDITKVVVNLVKTCSVCDENEPQHEVKSPLNKKAATATDVSDADYTYVISDPTCDTEGSIVYTWTNGLTGEDAKTLTETAKLDKATGEAKTDIVAGQTIYEGGTHKITLNGKEVAVIDGRVYDADGTTEIVVRSDKLTMVSDSANSCSDTTLTGDKAYILCEDCDKLILLENAKTAHTKPTLAADATYEVVTKAEFDALKATVPADYNDPQDGDTAIDKIYIIKADDCTVDIKIGYICTVCHEWTDYIDTPKKTAHKYHVEVTKQPDGEAGVATVTCENGTCEFTTTLALTEITDESIEDGTYTKNDKASVLPSCKGSGKDAYDYTINAIGSVTLAEPIVIQVEKVVNSDAHLVIDLEEGGIEHVWRNTITLADGTKELHEYTGRVCYSDPTDLHMVITKDVIITLDANGEEVKTEVTGFKAPSLKDITKDEIPQITTPEVPEEGEGD